MYVLLEFWQKIMAIPIMNPLSWFMIYGLALPFDLRCESGTLYVYSWVEMFVCLFFGIAQHKCCTHQFACDKKFADSFSLKWCHTSSVSNFTNWLMRASTTSTVPYLLYILFLFDCYQHFHMKSFQAQCIKAFVEYHLLKNYGALKIHQINNFKFCSLFNWCIAAVRFWPKCPLRFQESSWILVEDALKLQFLKSSVTSLFPSWAMSLPGYIGKVCEVRSVEIELAVLFVTYLFFTHSDLKIS